MKCCICDAEFWLRQIQLRNEKKIICHQCFMSEAALRQAGIVKAAARSKFGKQVRNA